MSDLPSGELDVIETLDIFRTGQTAEGTPLLDPEQLEASLGLLRVNGLYVQSIEAFRVEEDREVLDLEFCLLGLDGSEDPKDGYNTDRAYELTTKKIRAAKESRYEIRFKVWLDDISELDGSPT